MWLITSFGFFSVVEKMGDREQGVLTVRSRVRGDLEVLRRRWLPTMGPVKESKLSDYKFRARAPKAAVASAFALAIEDISYQNFKSEVGRSQGHAREALYGRVWAELTALQR